MKGRFYENFEWFRIDSKCGCIDSGSTADFKALFCRMGRSILGECGKNKKIPCVTGNDKNTSKTIKNCEKLLAKLPNM